MDFGSPDTWRWIWLAAAGIALVGGSVALSWLMFVLVSAACAAVLRPLARRLDRGSPYQSAGANRWVGRQATVLRDIPGGPGDTGLIRLDREEWRAESEFGVPIRAGSTVLVSRVDGTRLVVLPLEEPLPEGRNPDGPAELGA